jgi:sporulation protein YlmC with PRC-barrel domain
MGMQLELSVRERKHVISSEGKKVGDLVGVILETRVWTVTGVKVEVDKEMAAYLGIKKKMLKAPLVTITTDRISGIEDVVQLKYDLESLKAQSK